MKRAASLEAFLAAVRAPAQGTVRGSAVLKAEPFRVLGIDPGSRNTGWGLIEVHGARRTHVASGSIRCATGALPERLRRILDEIAAVIAEHQPAEAAIEEVFVRRNIASALILGQARGAALCALAGAKLPIAEYAPATIKSAIVGSGRAEKTQVQFMVTRLLNLRAALQADAADALAIALCHAQQRRTCGPAASSAVIGARSSTKMSP